MGCPGTGVADTCELPCGYWESSLVALKHSQCFLPTLNHRAISLDPIILFQFTFGSNPFIEKYMDVFQQSTSIACRKEKERGPFPILAMR